MKVPPQHDPACFGCGDNPIGFHLPHPEREGVDRYETTFSFDERHQGGPGLAHGGMVSALLDEVCGLLATWYRFPVVTGRIFLRYRRPVPINRPLLSRALVEEEKGRRVHVRGELWDSDELLAEARIAFVHVPLEHFLATPEGRAAGEAWRQRLSSES
ncbi:MAG: PaaI family thioesterase [Gaiellaceae bacterium]